jgi:hypothetical protein
MQGEGSVSSEIGVKFATIDTWIQISGMGRTMTYQWLAAGRLKAKKAGKRLLIDVEDGLREVRALPDAHIRLPNSRRPMARCPATQ